MNHESAARMSPGFRVFVKVNRCIVVLSWSLLAVLCVGTLVLASLLALCAVSEDRDDRQNAAAYQEFLNERSRSVAPDSPLDKHKRSEAQESTKGVEDRAPGQTSKDPTSGHLGQ